MKKLFAFLCVLCVFAVNAFSQTAVLFPLAQMTGTTNDTDITIKPVNNPVKFNSTIFWLPTAGILLHTTNGSAQTNLIPNDYTVTIKGIPGSWKISVNDTNVTLNAAEIGNLTTYTFTDLFGYVKKIVPGTGITISPGSGQGTVTINSTGGGGGGSASNAYQSQVSGVGLTIATNNGTFVYTFALNAALQSWSLLNPATYTNALVTAINALNTGLVAATNNIGIASGLSAFRATNTFDAAGAGVVAATASTNGYPWGSLYDATGAATAATNGLGIASGLAGMVNTNRFASSNVATAALAGIVKVDNSTITVASDGTISAATGGSGNVTGASSSTDATFALFQGTSGKILTNRNSTGTFGPSSFDPAGAATAATNGYPFGVLYDAAGTATSATNGYPWSALYDAAGVANNRTILHSNNTAQVSVAGNFNIVSGSPSNGILASVIDSTISGGGAYLGTNYIASTDATIAGGSSNRINSSSDGSVISGGDLNTIIGGPDESLESVISGGSQHTISGNQDFIGGGSANVISNGVDNSVIVGGANNFIYNSDSGNLITLDDVIGGGAGNTIGDSIFAIIPGGTHNLITTNGAGAYGSFITNTEPYAQKMGYGANAITVHSNGNVGVVGNLTAAGNTIDQWLIATNPADHSLNFSNTVFKTVPLTLLTNGTALLNGVPLINATGLGANQIPYTDASTNLASSANNVRFETTLAPASNQTNYTLDLNGPSLVQVWTANTNANFTFANVGTNHSLDVYVNALTSTVPCTVTFPPHIRLSGFASLSVSNTTSTYYHVDFFNGTDPTNAVVTGGSPYTIQ